MRRKTTLPTKIKYRDLFPSKAATEMFLFFAKEKGLGSLCWRRLSFQTSDQKSTVDPSPTLQEAIPLKRSASLRTSFHQKDPFSFAA
jgi:hypothetical protein